MNEAGQYLYTNGAVQLIGRPKVDVEPTGEKASSRPVKASPGLALLSDIGLEGSRLSLGETRLLMSPHCLRRPRSG